MSDEVIGKWIKSALGDFHIYYHPQQGIILGQNVSYTDNVRHSDRAVCFNKSGDVTYQYTVEGNPVHLTITDESAKILIANFLDLVQHVTAGQ